MLYTRGPVELLSNPMNNPATDTITLASAFTQRLAQLGMSRREFAKRSGLSRQTIHNVEVEQRTELAPATLAALDNALRWPTGKAYALANGEPFADSDGQSDEDKANGLRWVLVKRLDSLSLAELETMIYQWADETNATDND